ncbi:MAG: hypothetical protein QMD95_00340 [Candidatus Hodarchaeaceae archaeon]|nr:hypothetical protein [Candidatus Hodarchaeaceae archaeon]
MEALRKAYLIPHGRGLRGDALRKLCLLATSIGILIALCLLAPSSAQVLGRKTEIEVRADGSAIWVIENKFPLTTLDNEIQLTISWFENSLKNRVDSAEVIAGRSMQIKDFTASGPVQYPDHKKVRYRFEWTNFAEVEETRLRIGDVFEPGFLDLPTTADSLTIRYPAGYRISEVIPTPSETTERELTWNGPRSFGFGKPSITLKPIPSPWPILALAAIIICGLVAGWFLWFKKLFRPMAKAAKKPEVPPAEKILKSDVERAVEILKEAGGKMYQTELVRRLDFSKSKGSALLSSMERAGTIQRTRMGRKNLITLKPKEAPPEE